VSGSGISWDVCKSATRSRLITMPPTHHSSFLQARCPSCRPNNRVKALRNVFFLQYRKKINSQLSQKVRIKISAGDTTKFCLMTSPKTSTKDCQKTGFTKTTGRPGRRQRNCSACISLHIRCRCRSTSASRERTSSTPNARRLQCAPSSVAWPSRSPCSTS